MIKGYTIIEKILLNHSDQTDIKPGDIVDISIDARVARDFGGANVVNNLEKYNLKIDDSAKTYFTFDCNPGGSDQKYAANQQRCRKFARANKINIYDINSGIGTHLAIDEKLILPGGTFVSTDSHANIIGAIGAFGQGMGDQDIAATWSKGKVWFKTPESVKIIIKGTPPEYVHAKDIVLAMLNKFGSSQLLGKSVEIYGDYIDTLSLSDRITISSMATEMGAIIILFPPNEAVLSYFGGKAKPVYSDESANYADIIEFDLSNCTNYVSKPGNPANAVPVGEIKGIKIDSAFLGSCTNGRYEDMKIAADLLKNKKVAPGVVLKIVPATNEIWDRCLKDGIIEIFKNAGALVGNAGCAGCAAGQIGQNGPGEVTISTGNRNFPGKQGAGHVYLASPATVIASAIAGYICETANIPDKPAKFEVAVSEVTNKVTDKIKEDFPIKIKGRVWIVDVNDIDTDMIYHNRYLSIVDIKEMGQYTFDNLEGWKDFSKKAQANDIIFTGSNFGCGSSRQQAVDCFKALKIGAIIAESFGAIYERNAINAGFPILTLKKSIKDLELKNGDIIELNLETGKIIKENDNKEIEINPFFPAQKEIYKKGGLLNSCS